MFDAICWLIAMVIFLLFELATVALTTIWFAAGALVACIASLFIDSLFVQLLIFAGVSIVMLVLLRPSMTRKFNEKTNKTNIDEWIGKRVRIIEKVDNKVESGCAVLNGQEWTARSQDESVTFDVGDMATVANITGVKLILTK